MWRDVVSVFEFESVHFIMTTHVHMSCPSRSPSFDTPTLSPTSQPTASPSFEPSSDPTSAPSTPFCNSIRVDIIDFAGFDSDELNRNVSLQEEVANVTHHALAQTMLMTYSNFDIDTFYVLYDDSLDANLYENGNIQQSVHIDQTLCTSYESKLDLLTRIIRNDGDEISTIMATKLTMLYLDGVASDSMSVFLIDPSQFR